MFIAEEMAFLRAILDVPEDRNTWLIYADWLDDRADPRAEFLRLVVARSLMPVDDPARPDVESRLLQLRAELDPNWMMMFDTAVVANCRDCKWDDMIATDVPDIRLCRDCRRSVVYCQTLEDAKQYDSCGQRVALSTRIPADEVARDPVFAPPAPAPEVEGYDFDSGEYELPAPPVPPVVFPPVPLPLPSPLPSLPAKPPVQRPWWKFW